MDEILTMLERTKDRWAKLGAEIGDTFWSSLMKVIDISKALGGKVLSGTNNSFVGGGSLPLRAFATGGAVFGPTLALVGENASRSNPEYIIPSGNLNGNDSTERLLRSVLSELRKLNQQTVPDMTRNIALSVNGLGGNI